MSRRARVALGQTCRIWPNGNHTIENPDGSSSYVFGSITSGEDSFARNSVYDFAANEYRESLEDAAELRRRRDEGLDRMLGVDRRPFKRVAPFEEFLEQSRDLRKRRERDATWYNDSTRHESGIRRTDL